MSDKKLNNQQLIEIAKGKKSLWDIVGQANYKGSEFINEDLVKFQGAGLDFTGSFWENVTVKLSDFEGANFEGATFKNVTLQTTNLDSAVFNGASFDGKCSITGSLEKTNFSGCSMPEFAFLSLTAKGVNLSGVDMRNGYFKGETKIYDSNLKDFGFPERAEKVRIWNSDLQNTSPKFGRDSLLMNCNVKGMDLSGQTIGKGIGKNVLIRECEPMTHMNFSNAVVGLDLSGIDLSNGDLRGANMERCQVDQETSLKGIQWDESTRLPKLASIALIDDKYLKPAIGALTVFGFFDSPKG